MYQATFYILGYMYDITYKENNISMLLQSSRVDKNPKIQRNIMVLSFFIFIRNTRISFLTCSKFSCIQLPHETVEIVSITNNYIFNF